LNLSEKRKSLAVKRLLAQCLVEVKPRIKKTLWMNIYETDNCFIWPRKSDADLSAEVTKVDQGYCRLACVKVEIYCEEGEGL